MKNSESSAFAFGMANERSDMYELGLSKREYFAGLAMQALIVRNNVSNERIANDAIEIADELLKQLEK